MLSHTHVLLKDRNFLILSERDFSPATDVKFQILANTHEIKNPIHLILEEVTEQSIPNKKSMYVSKESLTFPLIVRKWENGDYFYPAGMQGKKKLSKYFKDEKLSLLEKQDQWLLCDANNTIIWVLGLRKDARYISIAPASKQLKITIQ